MTMPLGRIRIVVSTDSDIVVARQAGRELAQQVGCTATDATLVATAISEVARNIVSHAGKDVLRMDGRRRCNSGACRLDLRSANGEPEGAAVLRVDVHEDE